MELMDGIVGIGSKLLNPLHSQPLNLILNRRDSTFNLDPIKDSYFHMA